MGEWADSSRDLRRSKNSPGFPGSAPMADREPVPVRIRSGEASAMDRFAVYPEEHSAIRCSGEYPEAAFAIRNNYCRCTGYKKIIDAILLAAKMLRENLPVPSESTSVKVGSKVHRVDVEEKVLGTGQYVDDLDQVDIPGMIYGSAVRSKYPRARVLAIHTEKAKALPGVVCVLTAEDVPGKNKVGHLKQD